MLNKLNIVVFAILINSILILAACSTKASVVRVEMRENMLIESWFRIERWLSINASQIRDSLQSPASEDLIYKLEEIIGDRLPKDFVDLYRIHNGINSEATANLVYGLQFYSIEKVILEYAQLKEFDSITEVKYSDFGIKKSSISSIMRIPIGDDSGKCRLFLDLDPGPGGHMGQVVLYDLEFNVALKLASSLREMYSNFADDLETGKYTLMEDALLDGVHWLEPEANLDVINWQNSTRWKSVNKR